MEYDVCCPPEGALYNGKRMSPLYYKRQTIREVCEHNCLHMIFGYQLSKIFEWDHMIEKVYFDWPLIIISREETVKYSYKHIHMLRPNVIHIRYQHLIFRGSNAILSWQIGSNGILGIHG